MPIYGYRCQACAELSSFLIEMPRSVRDNIDAARSGDSPEGLDL